MNKVAVLGSINMDLVVSSSRAPAGGETISGSSFQTIPGGKGANQAVAIARQGRDVVMIARVGDDGFGDELIAKLAENKVDVTRIKKEEGCSTGVALIVVEEMGQNRIIIVAGANGKVSTVDVDEANDIFDQSDFLVMQLEVPLTTVIYAITAAKSKGVKTVLNAAPAPTRSIEESILKQIDYLLVNETEAEAMADMPVKDLESASKTAQFLQHKTNGTVILTMGNQGAITADGNSVWHTPSFQVNAVDTTAAGDAFTGGLIASLHKDLALKDAIIYANAAGALAACKFGAQPSLPTTEEIENFLSSNKPKED